MKKVLVLVAIILATQLVGQSYPFKLSGTVLLEKEKTPVESATIHLERLKDSSVVSYTISNEKGQFTLEGKTFYKNLKMVVSFVGMKNYEKKIPFHQLQNFKAATINLQEENVLDEVIVKSRAPITVKKDTLEFNVKSFKTKKDANVEDLLKKLPGVEVDAEGKITVNGKPVNKILVNGKPFFGNDPSITTKNLTKEIIEKVQITDTKSKSESFTGEKGDANNKTINLTIKKENNKGWFGRVSAGAGTEKRYEAATMVNRFDNNQRFSVLASTNNINSPGFSFGEIQKMFGGGNMWISDDGSFGINGRRFGGGSGIIKSKTAGATYADEYGKGVDVNANYFYSGSSSQDVAKNNREYTIPDNNYFTNSNSNSNDENDNHSVSLEFDIEIDSTFLINVAPNFVYNTRNGSYNRSENSLDANKVLTNSFTSNSRSESEATNFKNEIEITKKIDTLGSFVKIAIENRIDKSDTDNYNNSTAKEYGASPTTTQLNQYSDVSNDANSFETKITYRYPLIAKKLFLDASYRYEDSEEKNKNSTYDFNETQQDFLDFNTRSSSDFTYTDITKTPALEVVYKTKKWRFNIETAYVNRTLKNEDKLRPILNLERDFKAIGLDASFRYRFDSKASIYFNYSLDNDAPELRQIQPFENVANQLNIITGNPNLSPTKRHRAYINFNKYNWQKRTGMFFYISGSFYNDQVVSDTKILPSLRRESSYANASGGYDIWSGGSYSKKIKLDSISSLKFRVGANVSAYKDINILNDVKNTATTTAIRPSLGLTYELGKMLRIEPRYEINFSNTKYNTNNQQPQKFTRHSLRIRTKTNVPKKLEWRNDVRYNFNPNVVGFNKSSWFWNSTLAYSVFKDQGTLTLKAYDLLNQNTNVERRAASNYIEDKESTVLQRYFMLGFSWKFNSLGKKGKIRDFDFYH